MNSMVTTPTPPIRLRIRRKYWSVIPAIGARMSGCSSVTLPMRMVTGEHFRTEAPVEASEKTSAPAGLTGRGALRRDSYSENYGVGSPGLGGGGTFAAQNLEHSLPAVRVPPPGSGSGPTAAMQQSTQC